MLCDGRYSVEYSGVGVPPSGSGHLGCCSQVAVFTRHKEKPDQSCELGNLNGRGGEGKGRGGERGGEGEGKGWGGEGKGEGEGRGRGRSRDEREEQQYTISNLHCKYDMLFFFFFSIRLSKLQDCVSDVLLLDNVFTSCLFVCLFVCSF